MVSHVSLAVELDLLLHLLALPSAVVCAAGVTPGTQPMFASGAVAALYAATVLCSSGELFSLLHAFTQNMTLLGLQACHLVMLKASHAIMTLQCMYAVRTAFYSGIHS